MTGRTLAGIFLITAGLAVSAGSCSSETTGSTTTARIDPKLSILSVNGIALGNAASFDGLCIEVPDEADPTFPIIVFTDGTINLRPPGYCAVVQDVQCGHLIVRVNGRENSRSATTVAIVHLGNLGNHYADLTITIEVVDDEGKLILTTADAGAPSMPVMQTVKVTTSKARPASGGPSDAGAEGG